MNEITMCSSAAPDGRDWSDLAAAVVAPDVQMTTAKWARLIQRESEEQRNKSLWSVSVLGKLMGT